MKSISKTVLLSFVLIVSGIANSQVQMRRMSADSDGIFHLRELQVILSSRDDTVRVDMVLPESMRSKEYKDITIEEGDKILMVNAKRVKHIDVLKKIYEETKIGETVKFGIKRKGQLYLVDFIKADPVSLPKGQIKIMTGGPDDANMEHGHRFDFKRGGWQGCG